MEDQSKIYQSQVKEIVEKIKIQSLNSFTIDGEEFYVYNQQPFNNYNRGFNTFGSNDFLDDKHQKETLQQFLTNKIYSRFYCGIPETHDHNKLPSKFERDAFMDQLSQANQTKDGFDYNWLIYSIDPTGNAFIQKGEELRWLQPNSYVFANPNQKELAVNTVVNLVKKREDRQLQPVFYHCFSDIIFPQEVEIARIYWNVKPEGATMLMKRLTEVLNDYKIPFQFKCLNHPSLYVRNDSAVLYLDKKHVSIVSILLPYILSDLEGYLKDETPLFTERLYKGVSFAEDPGKGQSFGMSRSIAIAEALIAMHLDDTTQKDSDYVMQYLAQRGFVLNRLHLNSHTALTPVFPKY